MKNFEELVRTHCAVKDKETVAKENAEQIVLDLQVQISDHNTRISRAQKQLRNAVTAQEKAIAFIVETDDYEVLKEKLDEADQQILLKKANIERLEYSLKITKERLAIYSVKE